tara:strand:+ start:139 stop:423 length:285 start_codon:yes stop_codon:yes gene_type:complete
MYLSVAVNILFFLPLNSNNPIKLSKPFFKANIACNANVLGVSLKVFNELSNSLIRKWQRPNQRNFSKPAAGELNSNYTKIYLTNHLRSFIKMQA